MSVFTGISSMTGVSSITNVATGIVTSGLVLHLDAGNAASYPGSGTTWTDLSGNSNTGILTNGPTYSSTNSGSILFDGTNDYVLETNPSTLRNQNFTVSIWINPETQNQAIISIIDFDHAGSPLQGWVLQSEDATTNRYFYLAWHNGSSFQPTGGGGIGAGRGIQLTTAVWQNITYTKNGTSLLGYKNGTQTYTGTAVNTNVNYVSSKNMRIGNCVAVSRPYKGNISQVAMYNRAISASEVTQNYNALRGRYGL
jgi:hypothetical protein